MVPGDRSDEPSFSAVNLVADEKEFREDIPELDQRELRKDTLEFEPVRRRAPRRRRGFRRLVIIIGIWYSSVIVMDYRAPVPSKESPISGLGQANSLLRGIL